MTEPRQWYNVGAVKLPERERTTASAVFSGHPERFYDIIGANTADDDEQYPVGSHTTYSALLTEAEAEAFDRASNSRYVDLDLDCPDAKLDGRHVPRINVQRYLRAERDAYPTLTGAGVRVAVLDEGTTAAARSVKNASLIAKAFFLPNGEPSGEVWAADQSHGCLTMSVTAPYGAQVVDAMVVDQNGSVNQSSFANALNWAVATQSAKVVNVSLGFASANVVTDAFTAVAAYDAMIMCAAGNDSARALKYPGSLCANYSYVHSVGSIDMILNRLSSFSNYHPSMTGLAIGELINGLDTTGAETEWYGTSAASPSAAQLVARIMSTGVSARQAGAALAATTRDFGLGEFQGGGVYSMQAALRWLDKEPPIVITRPSRPQNPGLPIW